MSRLARLVPFAACAVVGALTLLPQSVAAQGRSQERATVARGGNPAEQDENIRVAGGKNVRDEVGEPAPAEKMGEGAAARGSSNCRVHFDNRSSLFIATYADGTYRGELSPWGDVFTYVIAGATRLYARAGFTDGSVSTWGPRVIECPAGGDYQWMLYQ